jgi:16S rRNA (guanine527-N7)-methyltransferase
VRVKLGLSGEEIRGLEVLVATLERWQARINLVGDASLADIWRRHVLDSAQLLPLIPNRARVLLDLGSGAGFPGLVLAILGRDRAPALRVHLVESNARKCAFLGEVIRASGCVAQIHNIRIEAMNPFAADVVTARACAPLDRLLGHAEPFLGPGTRCLFLKGRNVERELTDSRESWKMRITRKTSATDSGGVTLILEGVSRRDDG